MKSYSHLFDKFIDEKLTELRGDDLKPPPLN